MQKTLFVHHRSGIGDLIWHLPYIRAVAATSAGGKVTVMARASSMAADILAGESCVAEVITYERRPRDKSRKGRHDGLSGQWQILTQLRQGRFERIVIFSGRPRYGMLAWLAGIRERLGFGFSFSQRLFLNRPPYIHPYRGLGSWVYPEASAFAIAHGFVAAPVVPKMQVPGDMRAEAERSLSALPRPLIALAIGSSVAHKQWGMKNFVELARALIERGCGVLVLGGPGEKTQAEQSFAALSGDAVRIMCQSSVLRSAAALTACDFCVGNDTGIINVAVALDVPALGLFGPTLPLTHDPLMHAVSAASMTEISVTDVLKRLAQIGGPIALPQ